MSDLFQKRAARVAVLCAVAFNAVLLLPELSISRYDLNDGILHYAVIARMSEALDLGEDPLDCWHTITSIGYPFHHSYPPLGHLAVLVLHRVLLQLPDLMTVFVWARYLLLCIYPITMFVGARWMGMSRITSATAAILSPLISSPGYGLELGSYIWRGSGLFAQQVAMVLLPLAMGAVCRATRHGRSLGPAVLLLAFSYLSHIIYGYIISISALLLLLLGPDRDRRGARLAIIFGLAVLGISFFVLPFLLDGEAINHSRWEESWKWDSIGHQRVLSQLLKGELFDTTGVRSGENRLPVFSLLVALGAILAIARPTRESRFLLGGFLLWLVIYFGRPTWGVLTALLPLSSDLPFHRLIGGVHFFGLLLAALGLGSIVERMLAAKRTWVAVLSVPTVILILLPVWIERVSFVREGARWGEENKAAHFNRSGEIQEVLDRVESSRPGRVYPGLAARWGGDYRVGSVPMHGVLTKESVDCLAFLYHAMSLPSDLMLHFDERRAAHYSMFNVSWVLAPADKEFPPFLELDLESGSSRLYRAPGGSVFEAIRADVTYRGEEADLYDIGKKWLDSRLPERGQHIEIQLGGGSGESSLSVDDPLPSPESLRGGSPGAVYDVESEGNTYRCTAHLREEGVLLFKMSYHPRWKVTVDGQESRPLLLTPGLCGVRLSPGWHTVSFRYSPPSWRWPLRLLGVLALTLPFFAAGRRALNRLEDGLCSSWIAATRRARRAVFSLPLARIRSERWALLALFLIVLAASLPFLQGSSHEGHDAVVYPRRLVEFHENIRNGILIPRWAPDLSHGYGQPQFIFAPPLLYILGEVFHLAGANVVLSIHFVCIIGIALGALGVFLLGRAFGGRWGGVLAAAAFTLGPYMLLDLYVRSAYAEALAIAFTPWILLGLWRLSEGSQRSGVTIPALGVAGVMLSHVGVALMFVPLCAFLVCALAYFRKDAKFFMRGAGAIALGLALAAYFWVPAFIERGDVRMDRALGASLDFRRHFVYVDQIWNSPWGHGISVAGRGDGISLEAGKVQLVLALLILIALPFRTSRMKGRRVALVCMAIGAGGGMFLMTPESSFLWEKISLLQYLQFPWRFLSLVTVCLAAIASFLPAFIPEGKRRAIGCGIVLAALIATQISRAGPKAYKPYVPKEHTALAISSGHLAVTTRREYEPRTVLQDTLLPDYSPIPAEFLDAGGEVELLGSHPEWKSLRVSREQPGKLRINLLHYAGWRADLDGVELPLEIEEGPGRIIVSIPAGEHRLELRFHSTALRIASGCLSALALLGLVTSLILNRRGDRLQRALRDPKR